MIPAQVHSRIEHTLDSGIASIQKVSGGSINQAAKITLANGNTCFLKWNTTADPRMFEAEQKGLQLLKSADTDLHIPAVYATGQTDTNIGFLVQEFINEAQPKPASAENFGHNLAKLHQHHESKFGLDHDNFIGRLPQSNNTHKNWTNFFITERIKPQLRMAAESGKLGSSTTDQFKKMYRKLPDIFPDEPASLLHGDLWGGNYFFDDSGDAAIFDPAVYYGHREMELAFTRLFGGFSTEFYRSYEDAYPMKPNFAERKDIYNLYPLLVHTNLFGGSYARQVKNIVRKF